MQPQINITMDNLWSTLEVFQHTEEANTFLQFCLVLPKNVCLAFLLIGIYTMSHGIEIIMHPLYAVLFLNLLVSCLSTVINIAAFALVSISKYIKVITY